MNMHTTNQGHDDQIKEKILHLLSIYPKVSYSMVQIGIGSSLPANMWRPVMQQLIAEKVVQEDIILSPTSTGRQQTYTVLSLVPAVPAS